MFNKNDFKILTQLNDFDKYDDYCNEIIEAHKELYSKLGKKHTIKLPVDIQKKITSHLSVKDVEKIACSYGIMEDFEYFQGILNDYDVCDEITFEEIITDKLKNNKTLSQFWKFIKRKHKIDNGNIDDFMSTIGNLTQLSDDKYWMYLTCNPMAFLKLGQFKCDDRSCFNLDRLDNKYNLTLFKNSFVVLMSKEKYDSFNNLINSPNIIGRCFGFFLDNSVFVTNFYMNNVSENTLKVAVIELIKEFFGYNNINIQYSQGSDCEITDLVSYSLACRGDDLLYFNSDAILINDKKNKIPDNLLNLTKKAELLSEEIIDNLYNSGCI